MTLRIGNKTWARRHSGTLLAEGRELINNPGAKAAELVRYGRRVKRHLEADASIADDEAWAEIIDSAESWQKAIVGIVVNGPDFRPLENFEWCAYSAPYEGRLAISLLLKDRGLPVSWMENAISDAHYSAKAYEMAIYEICKNADCGTIMRWLLSKNNPWWQIAGICACAAKPYLSAIFYTKCTEAFVGLMKKELRLKKYWLHRKFFAATCQIHVHDIAMRHVLQICRTELAKRAA